MQQILNKYIKKNFFQNDLYNFISNFNLKLNSVLIIGGAGTIGSSYIKGILKFKPSFICVVDVNENGLT